MRVVAIVQARTGSTRLPEKVLKKICDIPVLIHVIRRLEKCSNLNDIVIATTINENDDKIIDILKFEKVKKFRGSEEDVLDRYYKAATENNADVIVRITSDDPLIDYNLVDEIINKLIKENTDYSCNNMPRTYPIGLDCECFTFKALEMAWKNAVEKREREHVTPYIREHEELFTKSFVINNKNWANIRLTLDTEEDFILINTIYSHLYNKKKYNFCLHDIMELFDKYQKLQEINKNIKQKLE